MHVARQMDGSGPGLRLGRGVMEKIRIAERMTRRRSFGTGGFYFDNFPDFSDYMRSEGFTPVEIFGYTEHMRRTGQSVATSFYRGTESRLIIMCMNRGRYGIVSDPELPRALQTLGEIQDFMKRRLTTYASAVA